jgi:hypothetical protein
LAGVYGDDFDYTAGEVFGGERFYFFVYFDGWAAVVGAADDTGGDDCGAFGAAEGVFYMDGDAAPGVVHCDWDFALGDAGGSVIDGGGAGGVGVFVDGIEQFWRSGMGELDG